MHMAATAIGQRGEVITINTGTDLKPPLKKLPELVAANDAEAREISARLASGDLSPQAPCNSMISEWTDEQKSELTNVLGDIFGWH